MSIFFSLAPSWEGWKLHCCLNLRLGKVMGLPLELLFTFPPGFSPSWLQPALSYSLFPSACKIFQELQYFCNFSISLVSSLQLSMFI